MAQRLGTPALEFQGVGGEGWGADRAAQPISVGTVHEISLLSDPFCTDFFFFPFCPSLESKPICDLSASSVASRRIFWGTWRL